MEKKQYIAPSVEIFKIKQELLLTVSGEGIGFGGNASDNKVIGSDAKFFDEDDDDYWE